MDEATKQAILDAIKPKSTQLNSDDLIPGPITVTIENVRTDGDKIAIDISGEQPWKPWHPCKGMLRLMIEAFKTNEPSKWKGHKLTLYRDPKVLFKGLVVGGIRISHATGIDRPTDFKVTVTRDRKETYTIHPIEVAEVTDEDKAMIEQLTGEIAAAETMVVLEAIKFVIKTKQKCVQDALRSTYMSRQRELKQPENMDAEPSE